VIPEQVDVSVLTTGHDVADARLHRLTAVLVAQGLSVEVDGLGSPSSGPPEVRVRAVPRRSLGHRMLRSMLLPWTARGRVLIVLDPDLVLPALVRRWMSRWSGDRRRVVADVHEDYMKTLFDRSWAHGISLVAARLVVAGALRASTRADATVVVDDYLPPHRPRSRLVVRNLPIFDMLPPPSQPEPTPRALYVGDVRRSRGLRTMLSVLEACPEWSLDVVGPVAAADRRWLANWRATSPARDRVRFHGRRPPRDAWQLASGAWVGLCLLDPTPAFVAAMPSKILEYLACGLTVVTTPLPRAAALIVEAGAGAVVADVAAATETLRAWTDRPAQIAVHQAAARAWAYENLSQSDSYREFGRMMARLARTEQS